jgi:hypothetical protein
MKRIIFIVAVLLFASDLYAQKDSSFYRHEVKMSISDGFVATIFWTLDGDIKNNAFLHTNVSFSYLYRPIKWFWVGGNFNNYFGNKIYYNWREYDVNGRFRDFSKSKIKYCAVIAPEILFSYLNKKSIILYSSFSAGICFENGFNNKNRKYPEINSYFHLTYIGFSCNFGDDNNIFLGGEFGVGIKGICVFHGGYRF